MTFQRDELAEIIERIQGDIESHLPGANARLRRNLLSILSRTHGGVSAGLYDYQDWIAKQIFPDTADTENLERRASLYGLTRNAATFAVGNIIFTGTNASIIPAGTELQRSDGALYTTDAEGTIASGTATVAVTAVVAGINGNTANGDTLTLTNTIAGVNSQATVDAGGIAGGADVESNASLLLRLLERLRRAPHGGAAHDYVAWAKEAHTAVTRVWVYPLEGGDGTVTVRIATDNAPGGPIPDGAVVTAVQNYIDSVRPVTAIVTVVAPVADALDLDISISPDTAAVRAAVEAEVADLLKREARPGGTIAISKIREAISIAAGEVDHVLNSPVADVPHALNAMPVPGTYTWSAL